MRRLLFLPLLALALACQDAAIHQPESEQPIAAARSGKAACPIPADYVVSDEAGLLDALDEAQPGEVIGLAAFFELEETVMVDMDDLTITCVTPGAGLYGKPATPEDPLGRSFTLLWVRGDGVRVDRLTLNGSQLVDPLGAGPYFAGNVGGDPPVLDNVFSDNTVTCGTTCAWFNGVDRPVITDNYLDASVQEESFSAIQIQRQTTHARVEGNTVIGPAVEGTTGIRIRSGTDYIVVGNRVSGPWRHSIFATPVFSDPSQLRNSLFKSNRLEGAQNVGLLLAGHVCDWVVEDPGGTVVDECHRFSPAKDNVLRNNRITGAGFTGIFIDRACGNTIVGNNLQGNAEDTGLIFRQVDHFNFVDEFGNRHYGSNRGTGANVFAGNGTVVIDNGYPDLYLDCNDNGEMDPNIVNGAGAVLHGVNLGAGVSEGMSQWTGDGPPLQ